MNAFAMKRCLFTFAVLTLLIASLGGPRSSVSAAPLLALTTHITDTTRVSVASDGGNSNNNSFSSAVSGDGQYVVFASTATNLVALDTTGKMNIFRRDMQSGTTVLVSVGLTGLAADGASNNPSISADGNLVAFESDATNLVSGDTNHLTDIFVRDINAGTTTRASLTYSGIQSTLGWSKAPAISGDGKFVAFYSSAYNMTNPNTTNGRYHIYLRDLIGGTTALVSKDTGGTEADGNSYNPVISTTGRYVAFESDADNLTAGDTNGTRDIYWRDTVGNANKLVSIDTGVNSGNDQSSMASISGDGRYVAFKSRATNLIVGDTNTFDDIFVRDTQDNATTRVSLDSAGGQTNGYSSYPRISGNGQYVAFNSQASNLVDGDTNNTADVFVRDRINGITQRVSLGTNGEESGDPSMYPFISADGTYLTFETYASTLISGDTNNKSDIYFVPASGVFLDIGGNPTQVRVSVSILGPGPGSVTSSPAGISCGSTCVYWFDAGQDVTLTAVKGDSIVKFSGWGGDCSGTALACTTFTNLQSSKTVTATFVEYWIFLPLLMK